MSIAYIVTESKTVFDDSSGVTVQDVYFRALVEIFVRSLFHHSSRCFILALLLKMLWNGSIILAVSCPYVIFGCVLNRRRRLYFDVIFNLVCSSLY